MNMIDIKTNEAAIFSLYLNTRLMYGDKRYIEIIFLTVMLRNQLRKQTENTAKNLHLNYRALVYCQALCQFSSLIFSLKIDKD